MIFPGIMAATGKQAPGNSEYRILNRRPEFEIHHSICDIYMRHSAVQNALKMLIAREPGPLFSGCDQATSRSQQP
jgi:hypothetical protein